MSSVLVLQHAACEDIGSIRPALDKKGLTTQHVRPFQGDVVPASLGAHAGLIVMGGPMSVYEQDRYPHLTDELRLIRRTVDECRPVLGICLGSQLMAEALGGKVRRGAAKEIGWYPVRLSGNAAHDPIFSALPREFTAFHWHGDVFSLPPNAEPLASSDVTSLQAFRYGRSAYAILFHLEVSPESIEGMLDAFEQEIRAEALSPEAIMDDTAAHIVTVARLGTEIFDHWADLVRDAADKRCGP